MAKKDDAWAVFRRVLNSRLAETNMTGAELARRIQADEAQVRAWRNRDRGFPYLNQLPIIARVLSLGQDSHRSYDPLYLPRLMGIIPADVDETEYAALFDAAYRLQKLEVKISEAQVKAATWGRTHGASSVVQAALASGKWAVSVWPAIEGPIDYEMHVADRITIIRTNQDDPSPLTADEVWDDERMKTPLRASYAMRSNRTQRFTPAPDVPASHWSISYMGVPSSPVVSAPYPGLTSICISSLTLRSWVNDINSIVAAAIGYGVSTTRDMAMEVFGANLTQVSDGQRQAMHAAFLRKPPGKRCWSHHAIPSEVWSHPFGTDDTDLRDDLLYFWLQEDDLLLTRWSKEDPSRPSMEHLSGIRNRLENGLPIDRINRNVFILKIEDREGVAEKWERCFEIAGQILDHIVERKITSTPLLQAQEKLLDTSSSTFGPPFEWLKLSGCLAFQDHK